MELFLIFAVIIFIGLTIGSFLNVLIDRLPREETVLSGRSYCESCKKVLKWHDLIPLLSFVLLKGKCRYCGIKISYYYPIVELVTGIMFVLIWLNLEFFTPNFSFLNSSSFFSISHLSSLIFHLYIVSSLIVIFFADLKYGIIPDKILFPAILVTLIFNLKFLIFNQIQIFNYSIFNFLLSGLGAFLFFFILFIITKGKGMGFGDVKLAFLMGLVLGFSEIITAFYVAFLTGAFVSIILILLKKKKLKGSTIPFGPFMVFGTFIAMFFGDLVLKIIVK